MLTSTAALIIYAAVSTLISLVLYLRFRMLHREYDVLSSFYKQKVDALTRLQIEHHELQLKYHECGKKVSRATVALFSDPRDNHEQLKALAKNHKTTDSRISACCTNTPGLSSDEILPSIEPMVTGMALGALLTVDTSNTTLINKESSGSFDGGGASDSFDESSSSIVSDSSSSSSYSSSDSSSSSSYSSSD